MGLGEHMDAFISRGMVGQGSITKDWFKSTDRFEQEIGARVDRLDGQKTFADCFIVQDARLTLTHLLISTETPPAFLSLAPSVLRRTRGAAPLRTRLIDAGSNCASLVRVNCASLVNLISIWTMAV